MKILISKGGVAGKLRAPASKSNTIRGLMCAALARGESELHYPLVADDTEAASAVLSQLGTEIRREGDVWRVSGRAFHAPDKNLFCGDSAATLRFMMAICALVPGQSRLTTGPSLAKRPVGTLVNALRQLGVNLKANGELAPVVVRGGELTGGTTEIAGDISSQYISALLFIAPLAEQVITIRLTTPLESRPYILMTMECLEEFGIKVDTTPDLSQFTATPQAYRPASYRVEGDWSSASYFLALGALSGPVTVANLNPESRQGDKALLKILKDMGASVEIDKDMITVRKSGLRAIETDLTDCIDLLPTVAVLAAAASGKSVINGIGRARIKESNRVTAMKAGLSAMGIAVEENENQMIISGGTPRGASIDCASDHRIAMAFGVLGTVAGETIINDAGCVSKTYPDFWETLKSIGGEVKPNG